MDSLPEKVPKKRPGRKKIVRRNTNSPPEVRSLMSSPERTAKRLAALKLWREANPGKWGRPQGLQDGVGYKAYLKKLEVAKVTADKAIEIMAEKKIWVADNATAENAMRNAIEIMESQIGSTQSRLAAAKVVLEYTQQKPISKSETTLKTAEEFLASIVDTDNE